MNTLQTSKNDAILIRSVLYVYWENHCFLLMETINHYICKAKIINLFFDEFHFSRNPKKPGMENKKWQLFPV